MQCLLHIFALSFITAICLQAKSISTSPGTSFQKRHCQPKFLFERNGFGRSGEFYSLLEELGLQFSPERNRNIFYQNFESLELPKSSNQYLAAQTSIFKEILQ